MSEAVVQFHHLDSTLFRQAVLQRHFEDTRFQKIDTRRDEAFELSSDFAKFAKWFNHLVRTYLLADLHDEGIEKVNSELTDEFGGFDSLDERTVRQIDQLDKPSIMPEENTLAAVTQQLFKLCNMDRIRNIGQLAIVGAQELSQEIQDLVEILLGDILLQMVDAHLVRNCLSDKDDLVENLITDNIARMPLTIPRLVKSFASNERLVDILLRRKGTDMDSQELFPSIPYSNELYEDLKSYLPKPSLKEPSVWINPVVRAKFISWRARWIDPWAEPRVKDSIWEPYNVKVAQVINKLDHIPHCDADLINRLIPLMRSTDARAELAMSICLKMEELNDFDGLLSRELFALQKRSNPTVVELAVELEKKLNSAITEHSV